MLLGVYCGVVVCDGFFYLFVCLCGLFLVDI